MDISLSVPGPAAGADWQELASRALSPAGLNAPELLLPALWRQPGAMLATARDSEGLQLALPVVRRRWPIRLHESLATPVSFYGLPHLGRHMAIPAVSALLNHLRTPLLLHSVPRDSDLWDVLARGSGHFAVIDNWERAALRPHGSFATWFDNNFDRKRRKEYRRLESRLGEAGRRETLSLPAGATPGEWIDEFLSLEARGWKGRRGTAIQSDGKATEALREGLAGLAVAGKLRFWKLALDGRAIAAMYAIVEGNQAWLGKIAYDEEWARFSPGVQLMLHATEQLFAGDIALADSCAIPGHPMIDNIWRGRLAVADVMIASSRVPRFAFTACVAAEKARRNLRAAARSTFHRLTGRHRS